MSSYSLTAGMNQKDFLIMRILLDLRLCGSGLLGLLVLSQFTQSVSAWSGFYFSNSPWDFYLRSSGMFVTLRQRRAGDKRCCEIHLSCDFTSKENLFICLFTSWSFSFLQNNNTSKTCENYKLCFYKTLKYIEHKTKLSAVGELWLNEYLESVNKSTKLWILNVWYYLFLCFRNLVQFFRWKMRQKHF